MLPHNFDSWKQLIRNFPVKVRFGRPATELQIAAAEKSLGLRFPRQLRDLLRETNGVLNEYGHGPIWPVRMIKEQNREFRTMISFRELYMPFDNLLLFGAEPNSDHFALAVQADGEIHNKDIFIWDHETDARSWYAGCLEQFLEKQLNGEEVQDELEQ